MLLFQGDANLVLITHGCTGVAPAHGVMKSMFRRKTKDLVLQQADKPSSASSQQASGLGGDADTAAAVHQQEIEDPTEFSTFEPQPFQTAETILPNILPQEVPQASLSSKPLLASFSGPHSTPTSSPDRAAFLHSVADPVAYDPLSTAYEEHASTPKPMHAPIREDVTTSPADFDPLAATYEEYNLWQLTQQQQQEPDAEQMGSLTVQGPGNPTPAPAAAPTAARKTRSIPGFFKMRKTAAATNEASSTAQVSSLSEDTSSAVAVPAEDLDAGPVQLQTVDSTASSIAGSSVANKPHKGHKRGLSLLMRRTRSSLGAHKESLHTDAAQVQYTATAEELPSVPESAEPGLSESMQGNAQASSSEAQSQALSESTAAGSANPALYPARTPLVYLPTTFDSFMAGSRGVSALPQLSPRKVDAVRLDQARHTVYFLSTFAVVLSVETVWQALLQTDLELSTSVCSFLSICSKYMPLRCCRGTCTAHQSDHSTLLISIDVRDTALTSGLCESLHCFCEGTTPSELCLCRTKAQCLSNRLVCLLAGSRSHI